MASTSADQMMEEVEEVSGVEGQQGKGKGKEKVDEGHDEDASSRSSDEGEEGEDSDEFMRRPRTIGVYEGNPIDVNRQDPVTVEEYKVLPLPWFRAVSV